MELYHPVQIGNLSLSGNLFLAPVAGYSDRAFRSICTECGSDFAYTEMVSSEALTRNNQKTELLMRRAPNEKAYAVQIFGGNPETMAEAARIVLEKTTAECIDINGGCPVPKIIKTNAGSALTRNPEHLFKIVSSVVNAVKGQVPVTVKFRSGWDAEHITWKECAEAALQSGVAAITMHGRTRAQGYEGKSDWNALSELVKFVAEKTAGSKKIPVFGSGDAFSPEDAKRMLEETGVDAVMFARGAMGNPFLFTKTREFLTKGTITEIPVEKRIQAGFRELDLLVQDIGELSACREARKRFCAYSKGLEGGAALRKEIVAAETISDYKKIFAEFL
ncbi:tRNA dihydrouridine synthase DusB [Treponema sp.]|uniref:tRNA dihydrouridine synthase DusB n=1 Tax=Treponema sp. TaxID=166 RepID=UPI00388FB77F